jgi:hypothetical protein
MAPKQILAKVRQTPFNPFRLVLVDGAKFDIRHPDQCMVMKKDVLIGEVAGEADDFIDWTIKVNCWNVIGVEPIDRVELATVGA